MLCLKSGWLLRCSEPGELGYWGASLWHPSPEPRQLPKTPLMGLQGRDGGTDRHITSLPHGAAPVGCGMLPFPPRRDAGRVGVPRAAASSPNKRVCHSHPPVQGSAHPGVPHGMRDEPRVRETEARTSVASCCTGNVPLPPPKAPPQHPHRLQGDQLQECKGRAIKGSVIKPQQSRQPATRWGGEQEGRERRREKKKKKKK